MNYIFSRIRDAFSKGDSSLQIIWYWLPEIISATILFSLPVMVDSWVVAQLGSTTVYGALGVGANFLHTLIKLAESIPVASMAIVGRYNGAKEYSKCGESLADSMWTTCFLGLAQFIIIFFSARAIYRWLNVPTEMIAIGAPFLQLKSLGVLLVFTTFSLLGFIRAVKNTHIPMIINLVGVAAFVFFDYGLVLGTFGLPSMGIMGSAMATIIQYGIMNIGALAYIFFNPAYRKYFVRTFDSILSIPRILRLVNLSWPIIIDKTTIALAYVWLAKMIAPMGKYAIVSFNTVKDLERGAFIPVIAAAQVLTFLVSNRLGAKDIDGAYGNIKKLYIMTTGILLLTTIVLLWNTTYFVSIFDPKNKFTDFTVGVLPAISIFVFFDLTQVFLAGALRGAGDVKVVMWTRVLACAFFFVPISYIFSGMTSLPDSNRFILIFGSYYVATGIMGLVYLYRIKSQAWHKHLI